MGDRPGSHLGLRSRPDLAPKRLESRQRHHLMTRFDLSFRDLVGDLHHDYHSIGLFTIAFQPDLF